LNSAKLQRVISLFSRLPGVGERTAQRYVLYLLTSDDGVAKDLGHELQSIQDHVKPCSKCGNLADVEDAAEIPTCSIVARVHDLMAIERAGTMRGRYFVMGKVLSPLDGVGPDDLPLGAIARRVAEDGVTEIIVATPPSVDGEATALLLKREIGPIVARMSRIASGVPHGGDLEFADPITMGRALSGRRDI
jgi:recombination protein RecR